MRDVSDRKLRRPREGGDPVVRSSERRWVPASAGTTELCKQAGSTDMKKSFVVPAKAGPSGAFERRTLGSRFRGKTEHCNTAGSTEMRKGFVGPAKAGPGGAFERRTLGSRFRGKTELCKQVGATDMKKGFVVPAKAGTRWRVRAKDAGFPLPRERRS